MTHFTSIDENQKEVVALFSTFNQCDDFIWSYLFDNGLQYFAPTKNQDGHWVLIHCDFI